MIVMMIYKKQNVKISTWNINGYMSKGLNKFQDNSFINNLLKQDIFCLQETHCDLENCLNLSDFQRPVHLIRPRVKSSRKRHGGLSVYVHNSVRPGVQFLEHATNDFIWLKLNKSFFGFQENIYICFVYIPPEKKVLPVG